MQLAVNGINFLGPVNAYSASGSGTWQNAIGSTIGLSYFGDASNTQGANTPTNLPGVLLASFADTAASAADAFSFNAHGPFNAGALFGMSLGTSGTLAAWDGRVGDEPTLVGRKSDHIGDAGAGARHAGADGRRPAGPRLHSSRQGVIVSLSQYQRRAVSDKGELDAKVRELDAFLHTPFADEVDAEELARLERQLRIMVSYAEVLGDRIAAFRT